MLKTPLPRGAYYLIVTKWNGETELDYAQELRTAKMLVQDADEYIIIGDEGEVVDDKGNIDPDEALELHTRKARG
jgi:hypothetical protein